MGRLVSVKATSAVPVMLLDLVQFAYQASGLVSATIDTRSP